MDQPARPFARKYVRHSPGQHRSPSRNPLGFRFRRRSKRTEVLPHALSKFLAFFRRHRSPPFGHRTRPLTSAMKPRPRSEEHTSELQSHSDLVCRLLLEKKKKTQI